jgi:hypothetical protein
MREIDSKEIFQEVGALAKFPPKSTCNVPFHRRVEKTEEKQKNVKQKGIEM